MSRRPEGAAAQIAQAGTARVWIEVCGRCGRRYPLAAGTPLPWRCRCGGLLEFEPGVFDPLPAPGEDGADQRSMWRYRRALPAVGGALAGRVTLGETTTAAVDLGAGVWLKMDHQLPTGSFKARGAAVMIGVAAALGADRVVVDSSGNAGTAVAAYAAVAGLGAEIHVPRATSEAKVAAMAAHGAAVVIDPGDRQAASDAARARLDAGAGWYASHVYQPAFHQGVKTLAFELYEQVPGIGAGTVVVPAGNGTLVLGLWLGFGELVACGRMSRIPAIVAVQAERCAPLAGRVPQGETSAAGIAIAHPPRAGQVRAAVLASGGRVLTVSEAEIGAAQEFLAGRGVHVEPTAAVGWAGWAGWAEPDRGPESPLVVVMTGA